MWEVFREFRFQDIAPNWAQSHVQVPTPLILRDRVVIYFATRDSRGKSQLVSFSLDADDLNKVVEKNEEPLIELGPTGAFDEDGVMVSSVLDVDGDLFLYYTGWQRSFTVPYNTSAGLLIKPKSQSSFNRHSIGPILGRNNFEPFYVNTPYVYQTDGKFKMIYGSGKDWTLVNGKFEPTYFLKRCESSDGLIWTSPGQDFLEPRSKDESTVRATRFCSVGETRIIFSSRKVHDFRGGSGSYSMNQVPEPTSGTITDLRTKVNIVNSEKFPKQNMFAYPATFCLDTNYLLFNGSNFGKDSIFLARELL